MTGPIPASLSSLTNLKQLQLSDNQLTGPVFRSWLGNLTSLEGSGPPVDNQLTGMIPAELGTLARQELYLWGNQLTGSRQLAPPAWKNQLTGPIPAELGNLDQPGRAVPQWG